MKKTTDTFFEGKIQIQQRAKGYRFSIDPVIVAHHAEIPERAKILDIGTGSGIIPLVLAFLHPECRVYGIEIQKGLADSAIINVKNNGLGDRIKILNSDFMEINQKDINGPADVIISNPPYRKANSGRTNPECEKALARHEIAITLEKLLEKAGSMIRTGGTIYLIYPADRISEVIHEMKNVNLEPKSLRMIHSFIDQPAKLFMISGKKGSGPGVTVHPPLVIYESEGHYSREVEQMMRK